MYDRVDFMSYYVSDSQTLLFNKSSWYSRHVHVWTALHLLSVALENLWLPLMVVMGSLQSLFAVSALM